MSERRKKKGLTQHGSARSCFITAAISPPKNNRISALSHCSVSNTRNKSNLKAMRPRRIHPQTQRHRGRWIHPQTGGNCQKNERQMQFQHETARKPKVFFITGIRNNQSRSMSALNIKQILLSGSIAHFLGCVGCDQT